MSGGDVQIQELLNGFLKRFEDDLALVKKISEMTDEARVALGLSVEPAIRTEERVRVKILDAVLCDLRAVVGKVATVTGECDSWLEINGGRIACELAAKHEGHHSKTLIGRVEKDRIDATITWVMAPYIKAI